MQACASPQRFASKAFTQKRADFVIVGELCVDLTNQKGYPAVVQRTIPEWDLGIVIGYRKSGNLRK
jgi:hypothetical protein